MEYNLEKSIKRYLKRKIKITLGFIVAFLLSYNFVWAEGIEITQGDNGEILFNGEIFKEETHQFVGNTFDRNRYINTNILKIEVENDISNAVYIDVDKNDFTFINNGIIDIYNKCTEDAVDSIGTVSGIYVNKNNKIENNGNIISRIENSYTDADAYGIFISGNSDEIKNNGIIQSEFLGEDKGIIFTSSNGIYIFSYVKDLINNGLISSVVERSDINKFTQASGITIDVDGEIGTISNTGIIHAEGNNAHTIWDNGKIDILKNKGDISLYCDKLLPNTSPRVIYIATRLEKALDINNKGRIFAIQSEEENSVIYGNNIGKIENDGLIYLSIGKGKNGTVTLNGQKQGGIINLGAIINIQNDDNGRGVDFGAINIEASSNYGIISADKPLYFSYPDNKEKMVHYGLYLSEDGKILKFNEADGSFEEQVNKAEEISQEYSDINKTVINAGSDSKGIVQSIKSETIKNLIADKGYILNSYDKTVILNSTTGSKDINNSIINAVKNAVTFDGDNLTFGLENTIVNGGYEENIISGDGNKNILNISGTSIINGNINLGAGNDMLTLNNTVQINGTLDGGEGADNIDFAKSSGENINILYDISGFENSSVDTKVTLFEKTVSDNGDIKNLTAQVGDIIIKENGELVLRVDGTKKDTDEKITGHALYENTGSITAENGGKLTLNTIGFGESEVVDFKNTDLSYLKNEDVKLSSALHKGKINTDNNTIVVEAKTDIDDPEFENMSKYENLKKIHLSIINSGNLKEFNVSDEQLGAYLKYRHDIYAGNPYAYSSELSRKTMGMMRNLADKDLKPELNKWAVYGGFTHVDGGTENSYYGKGYYTYDIGSRDISADTKITGGYFKAEFGKSQDITTGIIFGGNNSETEIDTSKVEGDSFYFGAYAKKYLNNFRFTLGAGFQHGDYKGERTAVGYEGITETKKYDSNYHDRGFDIYGNIKYSKELGNNFFFEPSFTLSYTYLDQDGAEDEEGTLATETDSQYFDYSSGEINLDLRKSFAGEKLTHSLTAGISYERMLSGYDEEYITGRIKCGTDFDILVPEKEKDIFSLNAKYELETDKGILFDVKGSYRFEHDTNQNEWTVGTGIGYKF